MGESLLEFEAVARGVDHFRSTFRSLVCDLDLYAIECQNQFSARFQAMQFGAVDVFRYEGQGFRGRRSIGHIHSDPADDFLFVLPLNFSMEISQHQHHGVIEPGNFAFLSTLKPHEGHCGEPPHHSYSEFVLKVPGTLLRQHLPEIDRYCAIPISLKTGAGSVMFSLVESLLGEGRQMSDVQARLFGPVLVGSIVAATTDAAELRALWQPARQQAHERIRLKALAFIECNLSDPTLDTAKIAEHCHVSLRHLHASFATSSVGVGGLIREMRLQRCRAELRNPVVSRESIVQIAMRWGFSSSTSFTRAYKRRFGVVPSDERLS